MGVQHKESDSRSARSLSHPTSPCSGPGRGPRKKLGVALTSDPQPIPGDARLDSAEPRSTAFRTEPDSETDDPGCDSRGRVTGDLLGTEADGRKCGRPRSDASRPLGRGA